MLSELVNFNDLVTLVSNSGVQFLDFGLGQDFRKCMPGEFVVQESNRSLARLEYDERRNSHVHPRQPETALRSSITVNVDDSVRLLDDIWIPIPLLKKYESGDYGEGPTTWARARLVAVDPAEDPDRHSYRLVLAIDTTVFEDQDDLAYLAPTYRDVQTGDCFAFAYRAHHIGWFSEQPWIEGWINELYGELAEQRLRLYPDEIESRIKNLEPFAHYLNLLFVIGEYAGVPKIKLLRNAPEDMLQPIQVDMLLDVGNSRTCGVLVEKHPHQDPLGLRYELELRDLTQPHWVYAEPFVSRVEFSQANFGKNDWAFRSGRSDAFLWPTIARTGRESVFLGGRRTGNEGATGISSPKRYLWDEAPYEPGWKFNSASSSLNEFPAVAAPFTNLIDACGEALYELPEEERIPVFTPRYSRSSMMMFMLAEVLAQTLCQINSAAQRQKMPNAGMPRHLRSIILTVPPGMSKPEREIFEKRMQQAMGLIWKAFGWHGEDVPVDDPDNKPWPPYPAIKVQWDEATCAQIIYLFSEIDNHFSGRADEFIATTIRPRPDVKERKISIATIDIGGGTTDLVINDYCLDKGRGGNVGIDPKQRFRDGFKVAGDDILLELIQATLVPAFGNALMHHGIKHPQVVLSHLMGTAPVTIEDKVMRQQLAIQVMYPAGLFILKAYENFDPASQTPAKTFPLKDLIADQSPPTQRLLNHVTSLVRRHEPEEQPDFDLLNVPVSIDLCALHELFLTNRVSVCRTLRALCEIIHLFDCDLLLLTGRPSQLPGIEAVVRSLLPLPPDRIIKLSRYKVGGWYPFNRQGMIADPKTTAAVGAMLCMLGQGRLTNFFLHSNRFIPYSTIRNIGLMDKDHIIKDEDLYYTDVDLDDEDYELHQDTMLEVRGLMQLGYRQLNVERWAGSPLYTMDFADDQVRRRVQTQDELLLRVSLRRDKRGSEGFKVDRVETATGRSCNPNDVSLRFNTLTSAALGENSYWLDHGIII